MASYRYLTQDILTGEWLTTSAPFSGVSYTREVRGSGEFRARLEPRSLRSNPEWFHPARTAVWVERNRRLVWGGILWNARVDGNEYQLEGAGFSSYLWRRHDLHGNAGRDQTIGDPQKPNPWIDASPLDIVRTYVDYVQSSRFPTGNIGLEVVGSTFTRARVGTSEEPYSKDFWAGANVGDILDELCRIEPAFDWCDEVSWDGETPVKRLRLAYPRLGSRRKDVRLDSAVNMTAAPPVDWSGDDYADVVVAYGAGEGRSQTRQILERRGTGIPQLESVIDIPSMDHPWYPHAGAEYQRRQAWPMVPRVRLRDHPSARFGAFGLGDDVMVACHDEWRDIDAWHRVMGITVRPETDEGEVIEVELERSDAFQYGWVEW